MDSSREPLDPLGATWEGRMRQVANRELPYEQALAIALECVEVVERYAADRPQSMSPADPDAKLEIMANLPSGLECNVRLAVYSLYHGDNLLEREKAVEQLINCGKWSDAPT
jgi:hypothetical protein